MKILLATSEAVPKGGGIASYAQELLKIIGGENEVYLLTDADEGEVPGFRATWTNYQRDIYSYAYGREMVERINAAAFDLVIASNSTLVAVCAPFLSAPIVSVSHFVNGILAVTAGYNSRYLSNIVNLSHYGKAFMQRRFSITDPSKLSVVYNSVQCPDQPFDEAKLQRTTPILVFPGGCALHKSPDVVAGMLRRLLRTDLDFHFYWLGGLRIPFKRFSVCGEVSALIPDDPRVTFTGKIPREEAIRIIGSANVFVLPSRGEGCPISMLEAMSYGCIPVVSDAHHGSRELLEQGKFGVVTPQDQADRLYDAVCEILRHPEAFEANYRTTYRYSRSELSPERWKEQMMGILDRAVRQPKQVEPLSEKAFRKSADGFRKAYRMESYRIKVRDLCYCMKFNWMYWRGR